jgi:hypothetical protein
MSHFSNQYRLSEIGSSIIQILDSCLIMICLKLYIIAGGFTVRNISNGGTVPDHWCEQLIL